MHTQICQSCGALLHQQRPFCTACGSRTSQASTTGLVPLAVGATIEQKSALPDPRRVDRVLLALNQPNPATASEVPSQASAAARTDAFNPIPATPPASNGVPAGKFASPQESSATEPPGARREAESSAENKGLPGSSVKKPKSKKRKTAAPSGSQNPAPTQTLPWFINQASLNKLAFSCLLGLLSLSVFCVVAYVVPIMKESPARPAGTATAGVADLAGHWRVGVSSARLINIQWRAAMEQDRDRLTGVGSDRYGSFIIADGRITGSGIVFRKLYTSHGGIRSALTYQGVIEPTPAPSSFNPNPLMHLHGTWMQQGGDQGVWTAEVMDHLVNRSVQDSNPIVALLKQIFAFPEHFNGAEALQFYFRVLAFFALLVAGLVITSFRLFGASGYLNIRSKKKYIPSQYNSDWLKTLRDYGKGLKKGGMPLGARTDWSVFQMGAPKNISVPPSLRSANPHVLVLGGSGKGKSRLLANMITHDIESGDRAVVVIDSDGALTSLLLGWLAAHSHSSHLADRFMIMDPTARQQTLTFNPLQFPSDGDLRSAAQSVVSGFRAIYAEPPGSQSQWSQQTANILRNAVVLLMANGRTLTDLPALLSDNDFRDVLLDNLSKMKDHKTEYITLVEAWGQYKRLARTDQWITWVEPILNRVQPMLSDPNIRPIVTEVMGSLDLQNVITERKVLLVKVPKGRLEQNGKLLGSLIVAGLRQAAMALSVHESHDHPCALYLDEFPNFIEKDTYEGITSETRTLQIGLVGSCRTLQELPEDFRSKLTLNGAMCCFSLTKKDADLLGPQMFRVDGRKTKIVTLETLLNPINKAPLLEQVVDEEKLNVDRLSGQDDQCFYYYKVGGTTTVFHVRADSFVDHKKTGNWSIVDRIYARSSSGD